jgi:N-acetylmuramoyl-L-alanine amidase
MIENISSQLAAVIVSHNPKTIADIQSDYSATAISQNKVRILIVPGHQPDYGGAEYMSHYGDIKERDLVVELAQDLQTFLDGNNRYQVIVARDTESWNPIFTDYFKTEWNDIIDWENAYKQQFSAMVADGSLTLPKVIIDHATSTPDGIIQLYGMTKWANENNIDIEIHVHFNDYVGHGDKHGKYTGFAIYVPAAQYDNSTTTHAIADDVFKRLARYNPVSDLQGESTGIVDDPELIAVGANNTADAASMLIEYSYIYEPQLDNPATRDVFIKDLAFQTYLGLQDFFDPNNVISVAGSFDTLLLPHTWIETGASSTQIFALQTALLDDGDYPPSGKSLNNCPRTGTFGACTTAALQTFQQKYNISGENGIIGPKTIHVLNEKFGT